MKYTRRDVKRSQNNLMESYVSDMLAQLKDAAKSVLRRPVFGMQACCIPMVGTRQLECY